MESIDDTLARIIELKQQGLSWPEIGCEVDLSAGAARGRYDRHRAKQQKPNPCPDGTETEATVIGVTPDDYYPTAQEMERVWATLVEGQKKIFEMVRKRKQDQSITLPVPAALALLSDQHFGDSGTDYEMAREDAFIIRDTPGMFAELHGDLFNNWIIGKLANLQRGEVVDFDMEWQLCITYLEWLKGKLQAIVPGNHDNWVIKLAGIDRIREALKGTKALYHPYEVTFLLRVGPGSYKVKIRHKWKGSSVFNVTHGIEVGWERGGFDFDIGIGGHTHIGTFHRPFTRQGRELHAILTGAYKLLDGYGEEVGYAPTVHRGCGAIVFNRGGELMFFRELALAADFLEYLRDRDTEKHYNLG